MSKAVEVKAVHRVHYADANGKQCVLEPGDSCEMSRETFDELVKFGAVRAIKPVEDAPEPQPEQAVVLDADQNDPELEPELEPEPAAAPALTAKHKGGGRYIVVGADGEAVNDDLFNDKTSAQAWIDAQSAEDDGQGDLLA